MDVSGFDEGFQRGGSEEIINAPADVVRSGLTPVRPPSVALSVGVQQTESIEEAGREEIIDSEAFFGCEAGVVLVLFRAGEVEVGVGGVKITTSDDGLFCF